MYEAEKLVSRQRFRDGDHAYTIEVYAEEGGCVGRWECPKCGLSGRSPASQVSAESAAAWARRAALVHHAEL